ncbi:adenosylcobinamide kinase/adenosylcobinamide phosphate guanyltransferase [Mycobacterium intermedium]|uniref:Adenosylcobinamide kinase n=1 Tax=Mycobacterium intermedium TaxID=28445 RepID=A0A1E3SCQ5_MYCIE|nr:bifunctional adenosylcobinamide kinase/adenosylcobinamide-phosphate guanylyltransferase [Mycobacterium intermedium]MCV6962375.1 bifunctional adenosylcobinamide kinase/adenosylcobinamide-phosphate guanylyltransferase [Mycobacterium intermedium]ODQ99861.1 adenosylcobinamide kinase/adenosylcobinamide phosphate guanyltransferase [Mycobacterium intermedium]OPE51863.1 adenosylcobinamide kinase/adenosylcobinamide phosphate guanyltransferase [Mycobacterium intermedium]ORB05019.1 adenosylcobinamide k
MRTLVLGGIRSGKSRWAEEAIANSLEPGRPVCYLAPGPSVDGDPEWSERVARHRARRPGHWSTVETEDPEDVAAQLVRLTQTPTLVDDLGGWLTATMDRHDAWDGGSVEAPVAALVDAIGEFESTLMLVSPEVGLTVVPASKSGRRFADELGDLNQRVAALCDRVVLVVAGQPLTIKPTSPARA